MTWVVEPVRIADDNADVIDAPNVAQVNKARDIVAAGTVLAVPEAVHAVVSVRVVSKPQ